MPFVEELVAYDRTVGEVAEQIGADKLIYQDLEDLIEAVKSNNVNLDLLPPRDLKNDDPKKVVRDENKKIKQSYAKEKLNSDQMSRHYWRKRARAVNIAMLPPSRPSKEKLRKWQNSIVEAERVFANGILPNKQKSPK